MSLWTHPQVGQSKETDFFFFSEMIRASRKWCKRQKKRTHLGNRKAKQWEKSCHWGKRKQRELPFLYHSSGYETAATKACTQRSGHFSGFSTNISRHLGSNGLHRFSVYIISLWNIIPFTLINPHSDLQLRRLDPEVTGTHCYVNSSAGRVP